MLCLDSWAKVQRSTVHSPLNANIFGEVEFVSSYVTDRPYNPRVIEPAMAPSISKDNNQ
jgi:hypothetical protein